MCSCGMCGGVSFACIFIYINSIVIDLVLCLNFFHSILFKDLSIYNRHVRSTISDCHRDPTHASTTFGLPIPESGHFRCLQLPATQNNAATSSLMYDPSWTHMAMSVDNLSSIQCLYVH